MQWVVVGGKVQSRVRIFIIILVLYGSLGRILYGREEKDDELV